MMAPTAFRKRLAMICGMFSSSHAGERDNAAALADRLVREQGTTWETVIAGPPATDTRSGYGESPRGREQPRSDTRAESGPSDLEKVRAALAHQERLIQWEREFCQSIHLQLLRHRRLSAKQQQYLNRAYQKATA
jgi:hypothetical protein